MEIDIDYLLETLFMAMKGIPNTLNITVVSLLIAVPIAFLMSICKIYHVKVLQNIITVYVSFIRGTPVILQILIIYSLIPSLLNIVVKNMGLGINVFDVNPIVYAYIVFSLNTIAVLSEVFRSALITVNKGQLEAGLAIGMSSVQTYIRIIIPQALTVALPNICNTTINLIKGTSLAYLMTVKEITAIAKIQASYGYNYIESYIDIFIIYIIVCSIIQILFAIAEKYIGSYKTTKTVSKNVCL